MSVVPGSGLPYDELLDSGANDAAGKPFEPRLMWRRVLRDSENSVWRGRPRRGDAGPENPLDDVESVDEFCGGLGQPERQDPGSRPTNR